MKARVRCTDAACDVVVLLRMMLPYDRTLTSIQSFPPALVPDVLQELFVRQQSFGRANLKVLHALLDRYVTEGLRQPLEGSPVAELTLGQRAPRSLESATVASVA